LKRKHKHEEHVDESWLIPYADILTLLLALFIVLFAASEVNSQKFQEISDSFNQELQGGTGIMDQQAPVETPGDTSKLADLEEDGEEEENPEEEMTPEEKALQEDFKELGEIQEKIEAYIKEKGLSPRLQTQLTAKGLLLTIKEGVLYPSGSADITAAAETMATEIANLLVTDLPRNIYIEGHTDNIPTDGDEYPSNWELSSERAINFMKILLENEKLDPRKFSATGYGEYQPVATNDTAKGRAENRRVEVLISPHSVEGK
jgi:chemotaxis protein MotB